MSHGARGNWACAGVFFEWDRHSPSGCGLELCDATILGDKCPAPRQWRATSSLGRCDSKRVPNLDFLLRRDSIIIVIFNSVRLAHFTLADRAACCAMYMYCTLSLARLDDYTMPTSKLVPAPSCVFTRTWIEPGVGLDGVASKHDAGFWPILLINPLATFPIL